MSRGLGHVQRKILNLIAANPYGAWTIGDLCREVYGRRTITKARRVAVGRALRQITLPGTWEVAPPYYSGGIPLWLRDSCNHASVRAAHPNYSADHFKPGNNPKLPTIYDLVERNRSKAAKRSA